MYVIRKNVEIRGVGPTVVKKRLSSQEIFEVDKHQDNAREKYRKEWRQLIEVNPEKTITEIRSLNPKVYTWLYKDNNFG